MPRKRKVADECFAHNFKNLFVKFPCLTQVFIADLCGVTRQTVGNWCDGVSVPDANSLKKICDSLDVSADFLLGTQQKIAYNSISISMRTTCLTEESIRKIIYSPKFCDFVNCMAKSQEFLDLLQ